SIRPYGLPRHRHLAEIAAAVLLEPEVEIVFVPHLAPIDRGLLCTITARLRAGATREEVAAAFANAYATAPFVRLLGQGTLRSPREARGPNACASAGTAAGRHRRLTLGAALDNLVKGAAGQAVQNLNPMPGRPETEGLPR